ncbi:MAG: response regulator transcription factor [Lacunisphaera sp.]
MEGTAAEGRAAVTRTAPDLILLSLPLAGGTAAEIMREIHGASPAAKLIVQVDQIDEHLLHSIRNTTCHGLLFAPDETPATLGQAISRARQGLRTISPRIAELQAALRNDPLAFPKLLSDREQQVLGCIAGTMSDAEIGRHLGLSAETAHSHRKRIMKKLGINSTPHLIRYSLAKGFDAATPPSSGRASSLQ